MVLLIEEVQLEYLDLQIKIKGYMEDRRPASNMNPYNVLSK